MATPICTSTASPQRSTSQPEKRVEHEQPDRAQRFLEDQRNDPPAIRPGDIPWRYEAITPEWLTHILCREHPGAEVVGLKLDEADSGTSNRRRIFIDYNETGRALGLPGSVFCKTTADLLKRILLSMSALLSETSQSDPAANRYRGARTLSGDLRSGILRIDGDAEGFGQQRHLLQSPHVTKQQVEDQPTLLATLHGHFYRSPQLTQELGHLFRYDLRFETLDRDHDFRSMCEAGFHAAADCLPERLVAREADIWPATLQASARHGELPLTIIHGDVYLKNWYIRNDDGRMGLGDWQLTSRGHWSRDIVYTIVTALTVDQRRAWEKDLLGHYLRAFAARGGEAVPFEQAWLNYRQQLLTTLAWWTMTLTPAQDVPDMQPCDITVEFIRRIGTAMDDLDALGSIG